MWLDSAVPVGVGSQFVARFQGLLGLGALHIKDALFVIADTLKRDLPQKGLEHIDAALSPWAPNRVPRIDTQ